MQSTERFHGRVWDIRTDLVDLGDGQQVERDFVVHPGAVGIIAVDDDLHVLLVQQYRHPVAAMLWEPPAGLLDVAGEDPLEAAQRELFEEAGYRARAGRCCSTPSRRPAARVKSVRIFLAQDLTPVAEAERLLGEGEERDDAHPVGAARPRPRRTVFWRPAQPAVRDGRPRRDTGPHRRRRFDEAGRVALVSRRRAPELITSVSAELIAAACSREP